jgi:hypothetical protein
MVAPQVKEVAMKLRSGFLALIVFATGSSAFAGEVINPQAMGTEKALGCLLGMGPAGCETGFARRIPGMRVRQCLAPLPEEGSSYCGPGPLETVTYLGRNAGGFDVYDVRFMNSDMTYVIAPPAVDGKVPSFRIFDLPAGAVVPSYEVAVTSGAKYLQIIYRRAS